MSGLEAAQSLLRLAPFVIIILLAGALGALPTGVLVARRLRGVDIRRLSPHNLGLGAVVAAVGLPTLVAAAVLDLAKGALAVLLASALTSSPWLMVAAAAAVLLGHARSPGWFLAPTTDVRVKGIVVALGATVGLAGLGEISGLAAGAPVLVAAAVLLVPQLMGRRWGYLSLANVSATLSLPPALWLTRAQAPYVAAAAIFALAVLWSHKEHLARIADGVEPRLGERLPVPWVEGGEAVCAFMIHPMTVDDIWLTNRFRWMQPLRRRGWVSDRAVRWLARFMRPMKVEDLNPIITADGRRARVYLVGTPLLPDQIRAEPALAVRRAVEAAQLSANLGASVLGLGAYWSVVGNKGLDVAARAQIAITNGGAYTAGTVKMAVPVVLARLRARGIDPASVTAAVVGANGVVGFGICRGIVEHVGRLLMLGTDQARLDRSREVLQRRYPAATIEATTALEVLPQAHVIYTATSDPAPVVYPQHVRSGCILLDLGRPPDVDASVNAMAGVEVIPGGVVRLPGSPEIPDYYFNLSHYGASLVPACLAETVILGLDGCFDRASLGERTNADNVDYFITRGAELGFEVVTAGPEGGRQATNQDARSAQRAAVR
jgi:predicted amino acid dehydrogenase